MNSDGRSDDVDVEDSSFTGDRPGEIHRGDLVRHLALFVATGLSMAATYAAADVEGPRGRLSWVHGGQFASALLIILLAHELGHYVAARIHKVDASLPFFIPLPLLSPFGTMGAVIRMRGTIPSRRALLDIGAAGPLAGLAFAIPFYAWGIRSSPVVPFDPNLGGVFGESLLTRFLDWRFAPPVPEGSIQLASPVLFAAWAGFFVTMLNLLPIGQLDGGHVAYALFGRPQDRAAVHIHRGLLAFFFVSLASFLARDVAAGAGFRYIGRHVNASLFWLVWFEIVAILFSLAKGHDARRRIDDDSEELSPWVRIGAVVVLSVLASVGRESSSPPLWVCWFVCLALLLAMEARGGTLKPHTLFRHPDVGADDLGGLRTAIAWVALAFFVALFMPSPMPL